MAFSGSEFIFNGVHCLQHDLMLYDIGAYKQKEDISFSSAGKLITDSISREPSTLLYGTQANNPLTFDLVFCATPARMEQNIPFDRFEIESISSWLTGHDTWKWLKIIQPDLLDVQFKCLITELKTATFGSNPWAFSCTVTCDSPYAYRSEQISEYVCTGAQTDISFRNRSSYNGLYYPKLEITLKGATSVEIINHSNKNVNFKFENLPASVRTITVDNKSKVITNSADLNIYSCFNFGYLGLVRGQNKLSILGNCTLKFICNFLVNVGG